MMKKVTAWISCTLLLFTLAIACDSDGSGDTVAGVDKDKKISDLTEDEVYDLCVYVTKETGDFMSEEDQCLALGLSLIVQDVDKTVCEKAVETCIQETSSGGTGGQTAEEQCKDESDDEEDDEISDCDATVGEMNACIEDMKKLFSTNPLSGLSCSSSKDEVVQAMSEAGEEPEMPASCQAIDEKCPGLLSGE